MTTRKRTSKHLARGAAFVEGMLVAGTLAALLGLGMYVHRSSVAKLSGSHAAALAAWSAALDGCEQDSDVAAIGRDLLSRGASASPESLVDRAPFQLVGPAESEARAGLLSGAGESARAPRVARRLCGEAAGRGAGREALRQDVLHRLLPRFE